MSRFINNSSFRTRAIHFNGYASHNGLSRNSKSRPSHHGVSSYHSPEKRRNLVAESAAVPQQIASHNKELVDLLALLPPKVELSAYPVTQDAKDFIEKLDWSGASKVEISLDRLQRKLRSDDDLQKYFSTVINPFYSEHRFAYGLRYEIIKNPYPFLMRKMKVIGPVERIYLVRQLRALQMHLFIEGMISSRPVYFVRKTRKFVLDEDGLSQVPQRKDFREYIHDFQRFQKYIQNRGQKKSLQVMLRDGRFFPQEADESTLSAFFSSAEFLELNDQLRKSSHRLDAFFAHLDLVFDLMDKNRLLNRIGAQFALSLKRISIIRDMVIEGRDFNASWEQAPYITADETGLVFAKSPF